MNFKNIFKFLFIVLFLFFIVLVIANRTGYYKTKTVRNVALTNEQIKKFEKDIKDGKEIDVNSYLKDSYIDYSTNLSDDVYKITLKLEKMIDKTVKYIFKGASKMVND